MKKGFLLILSFYLVFHFFIPQLYYLIFGNVYIYSELQDSSAANKAFLLNFITIIVSGLIVYFLPLKEYEVKPVISSNAASELFYFSILYYIIFTIATGGFQNIIKGEASGTFLNYVNLFLAPTPLIMSALFLQKQKSSVVIMVLLYILVVTFRGSRSGVIVILLIFLIGFAFQNFHYYKSKLRSFLKYLLFFSPFLYVFATQLRLNGEPVEWELISKFIIGRVSYIELGMIPIHYKDNGTLDLSLFYDKYSLIHQLKLIFDTLIPGQIFQYDVMPNNYFRAIFMDYSIDFVTENYMSINITLPVYFYMMYGYAGVFLTIIFLVLYFLLMYSLRRHAFIVIILFSILYEMLTYFDWVMVFNRFFVTVLTLLTLKCYMLGRATFIKWVKQSN
jgi:hypothetical protein